jgi:hypothetical protein
MRRKTEEEIKKREEEENAQMLSESMRLVGKAEIRKRALKDAQEKEKLEAEMKRNKKKQKNNIRRGT